MMLDDDEIPLEGAPPSLPRALDPIAASCPLRPLGHRDGFYWIVDAAGQVRVLKERDMQARPIIASLLGARLDWAWTHFPREDKDGKVTGIHAAACGEWLVTACHAAGLWDPTCETRQPGVWPGDRAPIVHVGDAVRIDGDYLRAGFARDGALYPAAPRVARPEAACGPEAGQRLRDDIGLWCWRDRVGAPILLTGWVGVALLGAAARWRPGVFLTGGQGSGKSTLLRLLRATIPLAELTTDTSAAGLYQALADRPRTALLDEAEGSGGSGRLLELLRSSGGASGALVRRGSAEGAARTMRVLASVGMAAIGMPAMQPQDHARFTVLDLDQPGSEDRSAEMERSIAAAAAQARALWGRMLDRWQRWHDCLAVMREALVADGCAPREADQLGALLAGYWTMISDDPPRPQDVADTLRQIAGFIRRDAQVREDDGPARALQAFLTAPVALTTNKRSAVGALVVDAWSVDVATADAAAAELRMLGMVVRGDMLWVGNRSRPVAYLFRDTPWDGDRWRAELGRLPGAVPSGKSIRAGVYAGHCLGLPRAVLAPSLPDPEPPDV